MSTICAVSTPLAQGGISVIRISGKDALKVAKAVFRPLSCGDVSSMAGYSCAYGQIVDGHKAVDDVFARSPATAVYTLQKECCGCALKTGRSLRTGESLQSVPS